jgi:hypothetical protein
MSVRTGRAWTAALLLPCAVASATPSESEAASEEAEMPDCLELHESAQEQRLDGRLLDARERLRSCAIPTCPAMVRADCATLLSEIQRVVPTVVFELSNPELDATRVVVEVEGDPRALVFGAPFEFDAGSIEVRVVAPGYEAWSETLFLREGEKNRLVPIQLSMPPPPTLSPFLPGSEDAALSPTPDTPPLPAGDPPVLGYVFGGSALGAVATAAYFAVSALDRRAQARERCSPLCPKQDSDAIESDLFLADVAGGIAILAGGVSVTLLVMDRTPTGKAVSDLSRRGLYASMGGTFR